MCISLSTHHLERQHLTSHLTTSTRCSRLCSLTGDRGPETNKIATSQSASSRGCREHTLHQGPSRYFGHCSSRIGVLVVIAASAGRERHQLEAV